MNILSIHMGHNSTAGLMVDGQMVSLLSQEKIDNKKNSASFPEGAILAILRQSGLTQGDIDSVAIAGSEIDPPRAYEYLFSSGPAQTLRDSSLKQMLMAGIGKVSPAGVRLLKKMRKRRLVNEGREVLRSELTRMGLGNVPIHFIDHHECHAYGAYYGLRKDTDGEALIFTADGSGDGLSATVTIAGQGKWKRIAATPASCSLGGIYSNTTRFLGMKILEHEYKVMGLAPYCKEYYKSVYERVYKPVIGFDQDNPLVFKTSFDAAYFYDYLVKHATGERFDNIAGAAQHLLETMVVEWVRRAIAQTGIKTVYTGGGLFMNVKLNKRIQEMEGVEHAYFLPSSGDESNPIGAAYAVAISHGVEVQPLDSLYLGIGYERDALNAFIIANNLGAKYRVSEPEDMEESVAALLAKKEVVARFSGRCEWGARSLGNRAILAHPSHMESFYTVNDLIKCRDFWMPFAPSMLDTAAPGYLENYDPARCEAPYMITAYQATALGTEHFRAAMHQGDHTLRPQVVREGANPSYYKLIKAFERLTGVGGVLNTSLNLHGYPLVATPEQAMFTFEKSGLKHLALGPFLISKN